MMKDMEEQHKYFEGRLRDLENEITIIKQRDEEQETVNDKLMNIIEYDREEQGKYNDLFRNEMNDLRNLISSIGARGGGNKSKKKSKKKKKNKKKSKKISKKRKKTKYKKKK